MSQISFQTDSGKRRFLMGMAGTFLGLPTLLILWGASSGEEATMAAGLIIGLIIAPFAILLIFLVRRTRLLVSVEGLQLKNLGLAAFVPWSDIERFRLRHGFDGLVLREPSTEKWAERLRKTSSLSYYGSPMYDDEARILCEQKRFVDLKPFGQALRSRPFQDQLQRHAPALLESAVPPLEEDESERQKIRRWLWRIFVATSLLVTIGILIGMSDS